LPEAGESGKVFDSQFREVWMQAPEQFPGRPFLRGHHMVKIRLKRFGRKNHAFWRINAVDHRSPRDGKVVEELGYYDPTNKDAAKQVVINKVRYDYWVSKGAQPSDTVAQIAKRAVDAATLVAAKPQA
jgi:small subunit ribosomal protein S16